jgi:ABC-type phosphate transport system substrate-binding protein
MQSTAKLLGGMTAAAALSVGFAAQAATSPLYAGGSTLAEKVYRDIYNAYGSDASGDLAVGVNTPPSSPYNKNVELFYLGVGSGNGKKAYDAHDPSQYISGSRVPDNPPVASSRDFGPYYGSGTGSSWVPAASGPYFPKVSYSGSDDPLTSADVSSATALGYGTPIQVPSLVVAIALPFTPTAGWNPKGNKPTGGSSAVDLTTNVICGIFTGAITNWNNAEIKASNKNYQLGSGTITVVYRHDGSGTTFLMSNALLNQCGTTSHPVSTHPVPDQWLTDNGITYSSTAPHYLSGDSFFINVFNAGHLPSNFINNASLTGVSGGASGSHGVQLAVDATIGAIGYVSPDFVQPVATGNDTKGNPIAASANPQTYYTYINNKTASFLAPTAANATPIMSATTPPSFSGSPAPALNPLNWGVVNPTPTASNAYPIGGFTFIDLYSCYASATDVTNLVGTTSGQLGFFRWYYGSTTENKSIVNNTLAKDGFAPVPGAWLQAAKNLLTVETPTKISTPGKANTACAKVSKGA